VRKVNLKLVFCLGIQATSLSSMGLLSIYVQSGRLSYLALSSLAAVKLEDIFANFWNVILI